MHAADLQDRLGMDFDSGRVPVATRGLGRDLTRVPEARVPADRAGLPDTEALGRLPARRCRFDRCDHPLAQIDQQR